MGNFSGAKNSIGNFMRGWTGQSVQTTLPATFNQQQTLTPVSENRADVTIKQTPAMPINTHSMTLEELKVRRMERINKARGLVESTHVKVMLRFMDGLCLIGPFWILFWTTSEVGQMFTGKPFDYQDQTSWNVYAAALFGECILAGLTFMSQYADSYLRQLDPDSPERATMEKWMWGLNAAWIIFAAVSALGQFIYLRDLWHPAQGDVMKYALIVGRVSLYTVGEWACAKYLSWRMTTLKRITLEERMKSEAYAEMEKEETAARQRAAEADAHIARIEREREQAEYRERRQREMFEAQERRNQEILDRREARVRAFEEREDRRSDERYTSDQLQIAESQSLLRNLLQERSQQDQASYTDDLRGI